MNEPIASTVEKKSSVKMTTADIALVALSAAMIAVCSWISIPAAVPFTLQTFAIFTVAGLFGMKRGTLAVLVYLLLGAIGVPVLAGMTGGVDKIVGTTGGYLLGFLPTALLVGYVSQKCKGRLLPLGLAMLGGLLICYALGTAWFLLVYTHTVGAVSLSTVLGWCVLPFILPDCAKIFCALILCNRVRKYVGNR